MSSDDKLDNDVQLKDKLFETNDGNLFLKVNDHEKKECELDDENDPDTVCGIGFFKPKWIQKYASPRNYLILYCCIGIISGTYGSYLIGCMSTIEKRFSFKSKVSGSIMILDEVLPMFLGMLVGYFGGRTHRPRMIGFGMMLNSLCSFVSALPYFIYGPATHLTSFNSLEADKSGLEICGNEHQNENCDVDNLPPTMSAVLLLMFGAFLKGFGGLAYYAIGVTYMDDINKKGNTPMYLGLAFSLRLFGPLIGYLMSSFFLKFPENPFADPDFGPEDPRWIGGWWMGFVLQGILLFIFAVPMTLFPRRMPGQKKIPLDTNNQEGFFALFTGLYAAGKRLAKNPLFMLLVLNDIMAIFATYGHYVMLPRYMENQFNLSASDASLYSGTPAIGAFILATLSGGFLIWKFKPSARFIIGAMIAIDIIAFISFLLLMIPTCEHVEITNTGISHDWLIFEDDCNAGCNCSATAFSPVCGPDGKSLYFSPCYAGCKTSLNKTLSNCSCVSDSSGQERNFVTEGFCVNKDCWSQALAYIIFLPVFQFLVHIDKIGEAIMMLRSVEPQDKSVAVGTFEALICAFGLIPHPIVFGAITDSVCLLWENSCGKTGNCWLYDAQKFNFLLHGTCAACTAVSGLFMYGVYRKIDRMRELYDDDDDIDISQNKGDLGKTQQETDF